MWLLKSVTEYEGAMFHGIFSARDKAEEAKDWLESIEYPSEGFAIEQVTTDYALCPCGSFKPKKF